MLVDGCRVSGSKPRASHCCLEKLRKMSSSTGTLPDSFRWLIDISMAWEDSERPFADGVKTICKPVATYRARRLSVVLSPKVGTEGELGP